MIKITSYCQQCRRIKQISTIHIAIPVILILECGHYVEITNLNFGISQEI